jgi:putative flippase GtrA
VKNSVGAIVEYTKTEAGRKKLRYAGVSVVFVPVGQILIQSLGRFAFDRDYTKASLASAAILTLPNFFANKLFVWRDTSRDKLRTQVVVFWIAAMLGVAFATYLTWLVEKVVSDKSALVESAAVFGAQLAGFGLVWVGRFLVLDRWLFKVTHHGAEPSPEEIRELHADLPI